MHSITTALAVVALTMAQQVASVLASELLQIGSNKQLFIGPFDEHGRDTYLVESMKNVEITMNPAHVTGERLMVQDWPWGGTGILDMRQTENGDSKLRK